MALLIDTGVWLRLVNVDDQQHQRVVAALNRLQADGESLVTTTQNIAELWSVATRPVRDNGLGFSTADVARQLSQIVEPWCGFLFEDSGSYSVLKRLIIQYGVGGKQVHDARLVAIMLRNNIQRVLTLNVRDFQRYQPEGIIALSPDMLLATGN